MTQLLTGLPRALDLAQTDLAAIAARLEVVHTEAWLPAKPDHDRPTPIRAPNADPDFVAGETWDCGLGLHKAREAWESMSGHLDEAAGRVATVLSWVTGRPVPTPVVHEMALRGLVVASEVEVRATAIRRLAGRLKRLERVYVGLPPGEDAEWVAAVLMGESGKPAGSACQHITLAYDAVSDICPIVGTGQRPPVCKACRNPSSIGLREKGGKCHACAMRAYRAGARQRRAAVRGWQASA